MPQINAAGRYRGTIIGWNFQPSATSKSIGIFLQCQIKEWWNEATEPKQWEPLSGGDQQGDFEASGTIWIIGTDGTPNQEKIENFIRDTGWSGRPEQITGDEPWDPKDIQFTVDEEEYKGRKRYKIGFVNAYDYVGRGRDLSPDQARLIKSQYGSQLRAIAANVNRNAPKPQPPKPAAPVAAPVPVPAATPAPADPTQVISESRPDGSYQVPGGEWYTKDGERIPF